MAKSSVVLSARLARMASLSVALLFGAAVMDPVQASKLDNAPAAVQKKKAVQKAAQGNDTGHGMVGSANTQTGIVSDQSVSPFLLPDSIAMMQAAADKYAAIVSNGGWPKVPGGKLKKGSTGNAVAALNKRLYIEGYLREDAAKGEFAETFTSATEDALRRFQRNNGLSPSGAIDGPTLGQLNVPAERRLATIRANVPRIAEYSKDLGARYAVVNIPAQQIETVNNGQVFSRHNAIVGRPSRPTPVVMTPLTVIRFNPYWNAPASIVEKDILPRMISSKPSKVMSDMNMKVFEGVGGPEINPDRVNWRRAVVDNYHFRQEPGGGNAMATAKIEFKSPFGIYLHDTPEPQLFKSGQRFYSSGCVRVEGVATFINWVLQGQDGIDPSRIAELADTKERLDTPIAQAPQLRVAYLTAWPTRDGMAAFRSDVYELDNSGFVVGQPMPVGEGGPRYVLKPIPRSAAAVEEAEAAGFASFFRRGGAANDRDNPFTRDGVGARKSDSLVSSSQSAKKPEKAKAAKASSSSRKKNFFANLDDAPAALRKADADDTQAGKTKKKPAKKVAAADKKKAVTDEKKKSATDKKKAVASAEAGETKAKKVVKKDAQAASAKKDAAAAPDATKKAAADKCKAAADGKLPEGCKAPASAKKPVAKPEKTAAKADEKKAAAN